MKKLFHSSDRQVSISIQCNAYKMKAENELRIILQLFAKCPRAQ